MAKAVIVDIRSSLILTESFPEILNKGEPHISPWRARNEVSFVSSTSDLNPSHAIVRLFSNSWRIRLWMVSCLLFLENDTRAAIVWFQNNYMDANPDKFQSIILNRGGDVSISISVQDDVIIPSDHIKVLGITLDDSLKFDLHIADMCKKASRQINALKRVSKFLTQDSRKSIYRSFIAASFNYCPISWIFCRKKNTTKLEKLQECALRLVSCDKTATYDDLLKRGSFLSLKAFRTRCLAVEVYKCVHGLNLTYLNDLFTEPLANYNFRNKCRLH